MYTAFKFFIRFKQIDGGIYTASGEVNAGSYSEAVNYVINYHSWYGKIMSIYIEELPNSAIMKAGVNIIK